MLAKRQFFGNIPHVNTVQLAGVCAQRKIMRAIAISLFVALCSAVPNLYAQFTMGGLGTSMGMMGVGATSNGMIAKKIIVVPCIVKSWLKISGEMMSCSGLASCTRISSASSPPVRNRIKAVTP